MSMKPAYILIGFEAEININNCLLNRTLNVCQGLMYAEIERRLLCKKRMNKIMFIIEILWGDFHNMVKSHIIANLIGMPVIHP